MSVPQAAGSTGRPGMPAAVSGLVGKVAVLVIPCVLLGTLFVLSRVAPDDGGAMAAAARREVDRVWESSFSAPDLARLRQSAGTVTDDGTMLVERDGRFSVFVPAPGVEDCRILLQRFPLHVEAISVHRVGGDGPGAVLSDPAKQCGDGSFLSVSVAMPSVPGRSPAVAPAVRP